MGCWFEVCSFPCWLAWEVDLYTLDHIHKFLDTLPPYNLVSSNIINFDFGPYRSPLSLINDRYGIQKMDPSIVKASTSLMLSWLGFFYFCEISLRGFLLFPYECFIRYHFLKRQDWVEGTDPSQISKTSLSRLTNLRWSQDPRLWNFRGFFHNSILKYVWR